MSFVDKTTLYYTVMRMGGLLCLLSYFRVTYNKCFDFVVIYVFLPIDSFDFAVRPGNAWKKEPFQVEICNSTTIHQRHVAFYVNSHVLQTGVSKLK